MIHSLFGFQWSFKQPLRECTFSSVGRATDSLSVGPGFESLKVHQIVSVDNVQGTPVPIPNTEVKLNGADNTRLETTREDRETLTYT